MRTHGDGVGELPIALDLANPVSEPRTAGIQKIVVAFSEVVEPVDGTLDSNDVSITDSAATPYSARTLALIDGDTKLEITFDPGDLPDEERYTFEVIAAKFRSAASGLPLSGDTDCDVRGLVGDVNNDGSTNLMDAARVKGKNRVPVTTANAPDDANTDGEINLIDYAMVKSLNGNSAP